MTEVRRLIAYSFAYVGRQPRSFDLVNSNVALKRQLVFQLDFAKREGMNILTKIPDWTTCRTTPFVSRERFQHAVAIARSSNAELLLADIPELLSRMTLDNITKCVDVLNRLDIEVWDAVLGCTWGSMPGNERQSIVLRAARERKARSDTVKVGIQLSSVEKATYAHANHKLGNRANKLYADQRARRYQDFVLQEMAKVPANEKLSPSALAKALNDAGISSSRGGRWSYNTAKDLIARVSNLAANSTPL